MLQPKSSLKTAILATLGAVMLCALILLVWLGKNSVPTLWDQGRHTGLSYYYFNTLKLHGISHFIGALAHYNYYPPFYYLPSLPLYAVFGLHDATAIASNLIYLALLALFTFLSTY